jgi:hypothetical protein
VTVFLLLVAVACGGAKQKTPAAGSATIGSPGALGADGASCRAGADCASGVCEGEGCGDDGLPGVCMSSQRPCTRDLRPYCGCDGATFQTSGTCPGVRFEHRGPCEGDPLPALPNIEPPAPAPEPAP